MTAVDERTGVWLEQFLPQDSSAVLRRLRTDAFEEFSALGFPDARAEDWRFTNVLPIARTAFRRPAAAIAAVEDFLDWAHGPRIVLVNGRVTEISGSFPAGVTIGSLSEDDAAQVGRYADFRGNALTALNTALANEVVTIRFGVGVTAEQPLHIVCITAVSAEAVSAEAVATQPRALIIAEAGAQATIVESFGGSGAYFTNSVTEIMLAAGAGLDHYKVQMESAEASHIGRIAAKIERAAKYSTTSISLGGALARNESSVVLARDSEASLNGLYMATGNQHVDQLLTVDHAEPGASSVQLYKGVLDGKATAGFTGRIIVRENAQKSDARQTNRNLLLSEDAVVNARPELRIFADDVKCTHAATVGQLDPDAVYYLRTRGFSETEARGTLTNAFAQDIADRVKPEQLRAALERMLFESAAKRGTPHG